MDKIEKIRQEIKRRIEAIPSLFVSSVEASANSQLSDILKSLLAFIDSLEKPICELVDDPTDFQGLNAQAICNDYKGDCKNCPHNLKKEPDKSLEEEINRYLEPIHAADIQFEPFTQMTKCARHFAEWGAEHSGDKKRLTMVRKEKIEDHINELNDKYLGGVYSSYDMAKAYAEGNIDGQKWQKEQMMKEAVGGQVFGATDVKALYEGKVYVVSNLVQDTDYSIYPNDKVRIIVLPKEDEK